MKLRVAFLNLKQPEEWTVNKGKPDQRSGYTYKASVMLETGSVGTLKLTEALYNQLAQANPKFGNVFDIGFEPDFVLKTNSYGKPEEVLQMVPAAFEFVAVSMDAAPKPKTTPEQPKS